MSRQDISFDLICGRHAMQIHMNLDFSSRTDMMIFEDFKTKGVPYEVEVTTVFSRVIEEGDFVVDVGASLGFFSITAAKMGAHVVAVEPCVETFAQLFKHLQMNEIGTEVEIIPFPLYRKEQEVDYYIDRDSGGGSNSLWDPRLWWENDLTRANPEVRKLIATTLDRVCAGRTPKLIKIDVEGAEFQVLQGGTEVLQRHPPFIVLELNPFAMQQMGWTQRDLRAFMKISGYDPFVIHESGVLPSLSGTLGFAPPTIR